jgi:hypothetical protein
LAILALLLTKNERGRNTINKKQQLHGTIKNGGILPKNMHQNGRQVIRRKVHARK